MIGCFATEPQSHGAQAAVLFRIPNPNPPDFVSPCLCGKKRFEIIAAGSSTQPYLGTDRPAFSFFQRARRSAMTASAPAVFGM